MTVFVLPQTGSASARARKFLFSTCAFAIAAGLPAGAMAQTADAQADDAIEEVVVTGSRIQRSNLTSTTPVVSLDSEDILSSGEVDITALLREVPALFGSITQTNSVGSAATPDGAGVLDLRQLDSERTLTLVNGRRHVSGIEGTQAVDVTTIPLALIERVETITGGASAIYGADAVTGVVNFILRDDFEGLSYRAQAGVSDNGDASQFLVTATGGTNFADGRGNAVISLQFRDTDPIFNSDRDFAGLEQAFFGPNNQRLADAIGTDPDARNTFFANHRIPITSAFGLIGIFDARVPPFFTSDLIQGDPILSFPGSEIPGIPSAQVVDETGNLRPFNPGVTTGFFDAFGGDGIPTTTERDGLTTGIQQYTVNGNFTYQIHDQIRFFSENKFNYTQGFDRLGVSGFNDQIPISLDNPFIPEGILAQIEEFAVPNDIPVGIVVARDTLDTGPGDQQTDRYTFRTVNGFQGDLGNGITYELVYNFGRTESNVFTQNIRLDDRFQAAIDAVALTADTIGDLPNTIHKAVRNGAVVDITPETAQAGDIVCRSTIDPTAEPPIDPVFPHRPGFNTFDPGDGSCVPISIFGPNAISPEGGDFVTTRTRANVELTQQVVSLIFTGDNLGSFALPAGDIGWAAGVEYREEKSEDFPDPLSQSGLTFGTFGGAPSPVVGRFDVWEGFAEVAVPLLSGYEWVEDLSVDAAVRFSDYSTIGDTTTWKVGANWTPKPDVRFRGTVSQAVRAPNIFELFSPLQPQGFNPDDPCDPAFIDAGSEFREANCLAAVGPDFQDTLTARIIGQTGGNQNLQEETADTYTVGAVVTPSRWPGLSVTVDYWLIEISDAITPVAPQDLVDNCFDAPSLDNAFCELIERDPVTGNLSDFLSVEQNVAALEASGIDFEVRYDTELAGGEYGTLDASVIGTRMLKNDLFPFQQFPSEVDETLTEFGFPKWVVNLNADWAMDNWIVTWQTRFQSSQLLVGLDLEAVQSDPNFVNPSKTGDGWVHDLSARYRLFDNLTIYGGVNNIADRKPFLSALTRPGSPIGRFFFAGVTGNF